MLEKISNYIKHACFDGLSFPYAADPETGKPSVTLLFYWLSVAISISSLIALHFYKDLLIATGTSLVYVLVGFVMYRMRKLDHVKIDVDDQSIELEDKDENNEK